MLLAASEEDTCSSAVFKMKRIWTSVRLSLYYLDGNYGFQIGKMQMKTALFFLCVSLLQLLLNAQSGPQPNLVQEFELEQCQYKEKAQQAELQECSAHSAGLQSQITQRRENNNLVGVFVAFFATGLGIGAITMLALFLKRLKLPGIRKQLITVIVCSCWIIAVGWLLASDGALSRHPINLIVLLLIYSLPAVLFGSIVLWWLARTNAGVLRLW